MYRHVCIWKYYDMIVSRVGSNCLSLSFDHDCKKGSHSNRRKPVFRRNRELQGSLTIGTALYKVEKNHVWPPLLDLKKSFPEVSLSHTNKRDLSSMP